MNKEHIIMNQGDVKRYEIIQKTIKKELKTSEASEILNLTERQIRRLKSKVRKYGIKGLIHANRGKPSSRKVPDKETDRIIKIIKEKYWDFGPTFATEKLEENHRIKRDPKTIRNIMIKEGLWQPKRKKKEKHRAWRQRRLSYGELIQYDGSYEYWFENRAPKCCLIAAIDDATSQITYAKFDKHEGVEPTFRFWREYLKKLGKPLNIYVDKFSTYSMNHKFAKENPDTLTQFERAMNEFRIEIIKANSSQAKGRVERLFKTLQDRLIKELRLNNISTIKEADEFLEKVFIPRFNAKFSVQPETQANLHKKITKPEERNFPSIFSRQYERTIRNDYTVSYKNTWYQLEETQAVAMFPRETLIVEERFNKEIYLRLRGKYLNYNKLPERPKKISKKNIPWVLAKRTPNIPDKNHPWRKFQYTKN